MRLELIRKHYLAADTTLADTHFRRVIRVVAHRVIESYAPARNLLLVHAEFVAAFSAWFVRLRCWGFGRQLSHGCCWGA